MLEQQRHPCPVFVGFRVEGLGFRVRDASGGPPHPVIVTIRDIKDSIRVLLYSYYATSTGWGVPPKGCCASRGRVCFCRQHSAT